MFKITERLKILKIKAEYQYHRLMYYIFTVQIYIITLKLKFWRYVSALVGDYSEIQERRIVEDDDE